jgi:toxin ParE1/3/4
MRIEIDVFAEIEFQNAYVWYENQRLGLGLEFENCVEAAIGQLLKFPIFGGLITDEIRRILIRRFPYGIFYKINGDLIDEPLAVVPGARGPANA